MTSPVTPPDAVTYMPLDLSGAKKRVRETVWPDLNPQQADGLACVICGVSYLDTVVTRYPVGRSETDSQVFACESGPMSDCLDKAYEVIFNR